MRSEKRQRCARRYHVRVNRDEAAVLEALAAACSCSVPALMRRVTLGYRVTSTIDQQVLLHVIRLRGDLGRVGGLLKLRLAAGGGRAESGEAAEIRDLLGELQDLQAHIKAQLETL